MLKFSQNDYIEHWEYGIGKILTIDTNFVVVNFGEENSVEVPIEKTAFFQKLNPKGFLVKFFNDSEGIKNLISKESTEIIRLLIYDHDLDHERKIDRNKIKQYLTGTDRNTQGWRSNFSLISYEDWNKWWAKIVKKIDKDPWFDTSSKIEIVLRDKPVSIKEEILHSFLSEKNENKKLFEAEKLLKICKDKDDESIIIEVKNYLAGLNFELSTNENLGQTVFLCAELKMLGIDVKPFEAKAYEFTLKTITDSRLPVQKEISLYSFLTELPHYSVIDHFYLYLNGSKKIRLRIKKFLRSKKIKKFIFTIAEKRIKLTQSQILTFNSITRKDKESLYFDISEIVDFLEEKTTNEIFMALLLTPSIDFILKEVIAKIVVNRKMTSLVYRYLNDIDLIEESKIPFLNRFLSILGEENVEMAFQHILLNQKTAIMRPLIFICAYQNLLESKSFSLNIEKKQYLIDTADKTLSEDGVDNNKALRIKIGSLSSKLQGKEVYIQPLGNSKLIEFVKDRKNDNNKRIDSINILINRGLKLECQELAIKLIDGMGYSDIEIIKKISNKYKDTIFITNLFKKFIEQNNFSDKNDELIFYKYLLETENLDTFINYILSRESTDFVLNNLTKLKKIFSEKNITRKITKKIIELNSDNRNLNKDSIKNFSVIYSLPVEWIVNETINYLNEKEDKFKEILDKESIDQQKIIDTLIKQNDEQILVAIDRTSQRYEEHLANLIPLTKILIQIEETLDGNLNEVNYKNIIKKIKHDVLYVKEEFEGVLRILKVIDRE